jgi:hypothetical protein
MHVTIHDENDLQVSDMLDTYWTDYYMLFEGSV